MSIKIESWNRLLRRIDATHAHFAGEDVGESDARYQAGRAKEIREKNQAGMKPVSDFDKKSSAAIEDGMKKGWVTMSHTQLQSHLKQRLAFVNKRGSELQHYEDKGYDKAGDEWDREHPEIADEIIRHNYARSGMKPPPSVLPKPTFGPPVSSTAKIKPAGTKPKRVRTKKVKETDFKAIDAIFDKHGWSKHK